MAKNDNGNDVKLGFINRGPTSGAEGYGKGGLAGIKDETWIGYEQGTVNIASDVLNRISAQNGVQATDPEILAAREPFRVGRFMVKWIKAPPFFPERAVQHLRFIFEDMVKEVSGVPENSLDRIDITNGSVRATSSYPGIYKESGNTVSFKVTETSGRVVSKFLDYWISGISDRKTGVTHMYGAKMRGILPNMAGSVLYVLLGPTCRPEDVEFAAIWHECIPYQEKTSMANSGAIGEAGSGVELDVEFAGIYDRGPEIDILARKYVEAYNLYGQSFMDQLLPSYLYDAALMNDKTVKNEVSVDMNLRLQNIIDKLGEEEAVYSSEHLKQRRTLIESESVAWFSINSNVNSLNEMGINNNGYSDTIVKTTTIGTNTSTE
jgi:hypothetical protein